MQTKLPEVWLRGQLPDIPFQLQPVAHALLQAQEELAELMNEFPNDLLWQKPAGNASVGFHLQHLSGVLDRLFTYAKGDSLSEAQFEALKLEGNAEAAQADAKDLVDAFNIQVRKSIEELKNIKEETLLEERSVGRAMLPSSVQGLLFHAAEHTMRHLGQLLVTVKVLKAGKET